MEFLTGFACLAGGMALRAILNKFGIEICSVKGIAICLVVAILYIGIVTWMYVRK